MTPAAENIAKLIAYSISDWAVTDSEEIAVLGVLRADAVPDRTVMDLMAADLLDPLLNRVSNNRRQLIELLGGRLSPTAAASIRASVAKLGGENAHVFAVSNDLQANLASMGVTKAPVTHGPAVRVTVNGASSAPFTGSGATGTSPAALSISAVDQALLLSEHLATTRLYSNPIPGSLPGYLATLSAAERKGQALTLLQQPIVSMVPSSYAGNLPDRAAIIHCAAARYKLDGPTLAAFILAEQRDQSKREDAKDFVAATSVAQANTSIGLGQVLVSTVQHYDLFAGLLGMVTRSRLAHVQIARLLASDEFNIFAVANYIRRVADAGSRMDVTRLPKTKAAFPGINLGAYSGPSSTWPADNIRALASEYTSKAWDDGLSPGWGNFVFEARGDIQAAGVF